MLATTAPFEIRSIVRCICDDSPTAAVVSTFSGAYMISQFADWDKTRLIRGYSEYNERNFRGKFAGRPAPSLIFRQTPMIETELI